MAEELSFRCPLASGLHARPASHLALYSGRFACAIELWNERSRERADAKSVVALVALDVRRDDPCRLSFEGPDAAEARAALAAFVQDELAGCDAPVAEPGPHERRPLPRVLAQAGARALEGTPVSAGIGRGVLVVVGRLGLPSDAGLAGLEHGSAAQERARVERALHELCAELEGRLTARPDPTEAAILGAHLALVRDVGLRSAIEAGLAAGQGAARAVAAAGRRSAALLLRSPSALVRERAIDVEDLCCQVLERLPGMRVAPGVPRLEQASVVLAESLAPRQLLALERSALAGLLLEHAGTTSHAVILARSFGIPALTGVAARGVLRAGEQVVVDAHAGFALRADEPGVARYYERAQASLERRRARLARCAGLEARTRDGTRLELAANVASVEELEPAFASGAEGIGLFRTEMLFLERAAAPSEEEQRAIFARAVELARGRSLIVRTFDVGGDKPLAWLAREAQSEANPFLGRRGVRLYPELQATFDAHLRAILRASAAGPLWLMLPMVSTPAEVRWVRARLVAQQAALRAAGLPFDEALPLGIMLEVPAAAFVLDQMCTEVDFFSIGTNDLAQYFLAADRGNERVAALHDPHHPAFLRFLAQIVADVHRHGRWVGLCGALASDLASLPLLVGLGLDELSLAAPDLPRAKRELAALDAGECRALLARALACRDPQAVAGLLVAFRGRSGLPVVARELIALDSRASSKAEVIQELVDLLHGDLRTEDPQALEQALWAREETYSTGLGQGFAVPHCKSDALSCTSLALVRLAHPVDWDALDGQPVSCAILLAVRASDDERSHMRLFSSLARRLVQGSLRQRILAAPDESAILDCLSEEPPPPTQEPTDGRTP